MFKKIFRLSIKAVTLATKLLPQTVLISIGSEIGAIALEFLVKNLYNKGTRHKKINLSKKALDKLNNKIIFITEALVNHSNSKFDDELFQEVKKKIKNKSKV